MAALGDAQRVAVGKMDYRQFKAPETRKGGPAARMVGRQQFALAHGARQQRH